MARKLFELCGHDPERLFSPYCWRSRMALAHKGLAVETVPWRFTETERLAFAGSKTVPVLVDGDAAVADSAAIAEYLDTAYPDRPALFPGGPASYAFLAAWADTVLHAGIARLIVSDIPPLLDDVARDYFVKSREQRFGMTLGEVTAGREARLPDFRASLQPLRRVLARQPFLGGATPDYGDYIAFGCFMWARSVSPLRLLEADDPIWAWRERLLDRHDGMARRAPAAEADA